MIAQIHDSAMIPVQLRPMVRIAWFLVALAGLAGVAAAVPGYLEEFPGQYAGQVDLSPGLVGFFGILAVVFSLICVAVSLSLAVLLYIRRPHEVPAVTISFYLMFYAFVMGGPMEAIIAHWGYDSQWSFLGQTVLSTVPTIFLFVTFPNGRFVPAWSRWPVLISVVPILLILLFPNEDWVGYRTPLAGAAMLALGLVLASSIYAQIVRYRRYSTPRERRQTRWVVAGLILWFLYMAISTVPWVMTQRIPEGGQIPWWVPLAGSGWWLSLNILPLSLTVAILRHRLFDIDVLIRRTLVYSVLTAFLALIYFGTVVVLQSVFVAFSAQDSPVVVVISTLVIASMFGPLHRRIQAFIDRRFYRARYDAEKTLRNFADTAREEVDLDRLSESVVGVVEETMRPEKLSLWLKQE